MNFQPNNTWVGVAIKEGGIIGALGLETLEGSICRLDSLGSASAYWACFATLGIRIGFGLGGAAGLTLIIVHGTQFFIDVHNMDIGGPNVTIAIEDRIGNVGAARSIDKAAWASLKAFAGVAENAGKLSQVKESVIMNIVNNIMNSVSWASGSLPFGLAIDIPFAGAGLELSAYWTIEYRLQLKGLF